MIAQFNDIAQIWWQWMGSMFWQVSLLIILITALDMAIRRWAWPQVRYALWGLVFLKLIIPPVGLPSLSLSNDAFTIIEIHFPVASCIVDFRSRTFLPVLNTSVIF